MPEISKSKIVAGRKAVDAYREAHRALYSKPWHRGVPEEHTPLLNIMVKAFNGLGFNTIQEFFDASDLLNIQELGFADREDFEAKIYNLNKDAERYTRVDEETNESFEVVIDTPEAQALREALRFKWH